ncbi:hypothetical protein [Mesoterricola silvestris]|uniref:Uncharacterized protein n=1 Tax=Mesoterricola silvestris TaxID=2927979 RepID=A0AA48GKC2_9BACT|nr:hypothetical protein [Mesoterricola silvestris]BDU72927.1 hypothetical protein METEAL_21010 [Mesoterricola silvestris]
MSERLLRVTAPHFVAGAVWTFKGNAWVCTFTTAYIRLFMKLPGAKIAVKQTLGVPSWIKFDGGDGLVMPIVFAGNTLKDPAASI